MCALLAEPERRGNDVAMAFARAARLALAGLLAAPALLGAASALGHPLRIAIEPASWAGALAGFAGAGWLAGRRLHLVRKRTAALAGVFTVAGLLVTPAFRGLQGLTGREAALTVAGATLAPFAAAFLLTGVLAARLMGLGRLEPGELLLCAAGGLSGGALALLPFAWAWLRVDVPGETYLVMTLAVVGFLGALIAPFHITGLAIDKARERGPLARA
jgi:hypothetical protein